MTTFHKATQPVTSFFAQLSETKRAIGVIGGAVMFGVLLGGLVQDTIRETPRVARTALERADSLAPVLLDTRRRVITLETLSENRETRLERIERQLTIQLINGCLTLAELRATSTDECRTILENGNDQ